MQCNAMQWPIYSLWGPLSHHTEQNMYVSSQLCSPYSHPLILKKKTIWVEKTSRVSAVWKFWLCESLGCRMQQDAGYSWFKSWPWGQDPLPTTRPLSFCVFAFTIVVCVCICIFFAFAIVLVFICNVLTILAGSHLQPHFLSLDTLKCVLALQIRN